MEKQLKRGVLAVIFMVFMMGLTALASTTDVTIEVTYDQTSARSMLDMINDFRKGPDAWAWDKTNNDMVPYTNLSDLNYDYELEKVAMQRAAELAIYYSHTRPDGSGSQTAGGWDTPQNLYGNTCGENIAVGQTSAEEAFVKWREDNDNYDGQGHRRNMLGGSYGFSSIGIAHVIFNGSDCWVQEFGNGNHDTVTEAFNGNKQITISVDDSYFTNSGVKLMSSTNNLNVVYLSTEQLPEAYPYIWLSRSFNRDPTIKECPVIADLTWTPADDSIVSVSGNTVTGKKVGSTVVSTSYLGKTLSLPVTVKKIPISQCTVNVEGSADYAFGDAVIPRAVITYGSTTLTAGTDYEITATSNTTAGTASYTVTGIGNYEGTKTGTFTIRPLDISGAEVSAADAVYTGSALTPAPTVTLSGKTLTAGTDYTTAYSNNTNAGTATVTVTGKGNYTGSADGSFSISAASLSNANVNASNVTYTGSELKPAPTVTLNGKTLTSGTDYEIESYSNNTNVGSATVKVKGKGNYSGTASGTFTIDPASIEGAAVSIPDGTYTYTGSVHTPEPSVTFNGKTLTAGTDYSVSYSDNTDAGTATVTVTGEGNYSGTASGTFTIDPASLDGAAVSIPDDTYTYKGSAYTPVPTVTLNGTTLTAGTDYSVSYSANINAGTATVTVTGTNNYTGSAEGSFTISAASLASADVHAANVTYTGSECEPVPSVNITVRIENPDSTWTFVDTMLTAGTDYSVSYSDNTDAGTATVTVTGKGNYSGTASGTFTIDPASLDGAAVSIPDGTYTYTGSAYTPEPTVTFNGKTLTAGTDYSVSYSDNTDAGTATVTVTGEGNYSGTASGTFTIDPASIEGAAVSIPDGTYTYNGSAFTPEPTVTFNGKMLTAGTDYEIDSYSNNTDAGTATVTVTGKGNYSGTASGTFTIAPKDLSGADVSTPKQSYTGSELTPQPTVTLDGQTLSAGSDFDVSYENNTEQGTASVTVTGKGNYIGTVQGTFEISAPSQTEKDSSEETEPSQNQPADNSQKTDNTDQKAGTNTNNGKNGTVTAGVKAGTQFTYKKAVYRVTKAGASGAAEAAFVKPSSKKTTGFTIPATVNYRGVNYKVTSIGAKAFKGCTSLKKVTIGKNVKKIGSQAFYKCGKLRTVVINSKNLKKSSFGKNAFKGTYKKIRFTVPASKSKNYKKWIRKAGAPKTASYKKK